MASPTTGRSGLLLAAGISAALLTAGCAGISVQRTATPPERELVVGFLLLERVYGSELVAPHDVFQHTVFHTDSGMKVLTIGRTLAPIRSFEGLWLTPDHDLDSAPPLDVLVVPSAETNMDADLRDAQLVAWVRERGRRARFVVSLCDGAFVLAQAGLLDGRRCTTFPGDVARFRETFPHLDVVEGVSFVHDGPALTSAGGAISYDVAMYLVHHLYGEDVARGVGRGILIDWPPATLDMHVVAPR